MVLYHYGFEYMMYLYDWIGQHSVIRPFLLYKLQISNLYDL